MSDTRLYRSQHQKLLAMMNEVSGFLDPSTLAVNAPRVRSLLAQVASVLSVHLYLEDNELYAEMLNHWDPTVREKSKLFLDEMGGLMVTFKAYLTTYGATDQIQASPAAFINETKALFEAMSQRIVREESDLFVMVDGLPVLETP